MASSHSAFEQEAGDVQEGVSPPNSFDDDLAALADLFKATGWSFSGVESATLLADAPAQREQRSQHELVELEYTRVRERLIRDQEARYSRFAAALNTARGAFRKDPVSVASSGPFAAAAPRRRLRPDLRFLLQGAPSHPRCYGARGACWSAPGGA